MVLHELGSGLVTPPWLPLALVFLIGAVLVFLYRSMRRNIDRIEVPRRADLEAQASQPPASPGSPSA